MNAAKFRSVSRSMEGSAPGPPLPTRPGHMALCNLGLVFVLMILVVNCGYECRKVPICIEVDGGFRARAALADEAGPHGVMQFRVGVRAHDTRCELRI